MWQINGFQTYSERIHSSLLTTMPLLILKSSFNYLKTLKLQKNPDCPEERKPVQTGIITSSSAILEIVEELFVKYGFKFVLTGRLSSDCIENLFR